MKIFFRLLWLYLLFLIQTVIPRPQIDLIVLGLVIFSLHDPPLYAVILGIWSGLLLGLINPLSFGIHIVILTVIAFTTSMIRRFIYKDKIYFMIILVFALIFKYLTLFIFIRRQQSFLTWGITILIVLILAIPLDSLITNIFYHQWRMDVTENNY